MLSTNELHPTPKYLGFIVSKSANEKFQIPKKNQGLDMKEQLSGG